MQILKIPKERIAALIGKEGRQKLELERLTNARIDVDSETGEVEIKLIGAQDPLLELKLVNVVRAIGRGFSPENARALLKDEYYFEVLSIKDYVGKRPKHIARLKSRVIGTRGRTRRLIEELTGAKVSIYGSTVSIIGDYEQASAAKNALDMLLSGRKHSTVYRYLEKLRRLE